MRALIGTGSTPEPRPNALLVDRCTDRRSPPRIAPWTDLTSRIGGIGHEVVCAAVGLIGLDTVNLGHGRDAGDLVLSAIAERLAERMPEGSVVARTGGDRFVAVVEAEQNLDWAELAVELRRPVATDTGRVSVGISIGVAPGPSSEPGRLLDDAEQRLEDALRHGAGIVRAERVATRSADELVRFSGELVEAVESGGIRAHFQPVVDLLASRVVEFEALARWDGPVLRSADEFIPTAIATGVIVPLGAGILRDAVELARSVSTAIDHRGFVVSVNVSVREVLDPGFVDLVRCQLRRARIPAEMLQLEIPARIPLHDLPTVAARLDELRALGVQLALDDVGGAECSLMVLRELHVDVVKLHPMLVTDLGTNPRAEALMRALLDLGRHLGVRTVAKGVERPEQDAQLRSLGCRYGQGHLYGPVSPPLDLPFDDLVGPARIGVIDRAGRQRDQVIAELVATGAFDEKLLADLVIDAAAVASAPMAAITVVHHGRVWFAARHHVPLLEVEPEHSLCGLVVESGAELYAPDLRALPEQHAKRGRMLLEIGVTGYAGVPVRLTGGTVVAVLCVMWPDGPRDDTPSETVLGGLRVVASHVASAVELRSRLARVVAGPRSVTTG